MHGGQPQQGRRAEGGRRLRAAGRMYRSYLGGFRVKFCGRAGRGGRQTRAARARPGARAALASGRALRWLVDLGAAAVLLPEVSAMDGVPQPPEYHPEGDVLTHVVAVLDHVPDGDAVLSWSAVLHDVGKPPTFEVAADRIRFHGHDVLSAQMAEDVLARLRAPKALRLAVVDVCRQHIRFAALPQMRPARAERWLREPGFEQHLAFHRADCLGSHGKLEIYEFARRRLAELPPVAESLLQGRDVLALGVPMGPEVGALLRAVAREIDERAAPTSRAEALVLLRDAVRRGGQGAPDADR